MSRTCHNKNDGLWVDPRNPSSEDNGALTYVQDKYSSSVAVWGGITGNGKLKHDLAEGGQNAKHYCKSVVQGIVNPYNKAFGAENWTQRLPAPCKEIGNDGNFVTVQKTSTNGTTRNYKVDSTHCECICLRTMCTQQNLLTSTRLSIAGPGCATGRANARRLMPRRAFTPKFTKLGQKCLLITSSL
jgi:hypothetical protein